MKKIILLFVMVFAVAGVQARTDKFACNVTFPDKKSANCEYNTSTKTFSWSKANSNSMRILKDLKGNVDLSQFKWLNVKVKNLTSNFRILIYCDNNGSTTSYNETFTGDVRIDLTNITLTTDGHTYANINNIYIAGSGSTSEGSLNIEEADVYLEYEGNTTPFNDLSTEGTWPNTLVSLPVTVSSLLQIVGKDNGVSDYADITDYHAIIFKITDFVTQGGGKIRAFICNDGDESFTTRYAYPVSNTSVADWSAQNGPSGDGYYYIDVTDYSRLVGIKTNYYTTASDWKISEVYLVKKNLNITDGFDMADMVNDPVGATVNYDRTFTVDRKSTVCLPFALNESEVSAAGTFYELKRVDGTTLTFSPVTTTEAYKPYMFMATTATPFASLTNKEIVASEGATTSYTVGGYTFHGVLAHQNVPDGAYGYNAADGVFSKATSAAVTIDAFRGYITSDGSAHSLDVIFDDGETTGIQTIKQAQIQNNVMFNLQGQRVSENHKGLVIVNGKKIVMK